MNTKITILSLIFFMTSNSNIFGSDDHAQNLQLQNTFRRAVQDNDFANQIFTNPEVNANALMRYEPYGHTTTLPLIHACKYDLVNLARRLLRSSRANPNLADAEHNTPLYVVCQKNNVNLDMLRLLLEHGANVDTEHPVTGRSPIFQLLQPRRKYNFQTILTATKLLLEQNNEIADNPDNSGNTPLLPCIYHEHAKELIDLLLQHGANINHMNKDGQTILMRLCQNPSADHDLIAWLHQHGADPALLTEQGWQDFLRSIL